MALRLSLLLLAAAVLGHAAPVGAQCTTKADASLLQKSVKQVTNCNYKKLRNGPAVTCKTDARRRPARARSSTTRWRSRGAPTIRRPPPSTARRCTTSSAARRRSARASRTSSARSSATSCRGSRRADAESEGAPLDRQDPAQVPRDRRAGREPGDPARRRPAARRGGTAAPAARSTRRASPTRSSRCSRRGSIASGRTPRRCGRTSSSSSPTTSASTRSTPTHSIDGVTPVMPTVLNEIVEQGRHASRTASSRPRCARRAARACSPRKYSHTTGVHDNGGSRRRLRGVQRRVDARRSGCKAAGYHTGLYGKYINGYNAAAPYIPPGWDEWHAFKNVAYFDYTLREQRRRGRVRQRRRRLLDRRAARPRGAVHPRLRRAQQPFFLYFAPKAPHAPATPAPRHAGMFSGIPPWRPPNYNEADVSDKPAWVQAIAPWGANKQANQDAFDRKQLESLQAVDEAVAALCRRCTTSARSTTRSSSSRRTTATRGARTAGSRSSARTRSACACRSRSATSRWRRCRASRAASA